VRFLLEIICLLTQFKYSQQKMALFKAV
jgi:hypothetical protein